jgi:hypothetical protein
MKKLSTLILFVAAIVGCSEPRNVFNGEFHSVVKPTAISIQADTLAVDMPGAVDIHAADTLMIALSLTNQGHPLSVYGFRTLKHYGYFLHRGRGPNEYMFITDIDRGCRNDDGVVIWTTPQPGQTLIRLNLTESIRAGKAVVDRELDTDRNMAGKPAGRMYVNDSISLNRMVLDNKIELYDNNVQRAISSFIPFTVNDGEITWGTLRIKPDGSKLALAMKYFDQINICNLDGSDAHSYSFGRRPVSVESIGRGPELDDMKMYYRYIVAENDYIIAVYLPDKATSTE